MTGPAHRAAVGPSATCICTPPPSPQSVSMTSLPEDCCRDVELRFAAITSICHGASRFPASYSVGTSRLAFITCKRSTRPCSCSSNPRLRKPRRHQGRLLRFTASPAQPPRRLTAVAASLRAVAALPHRSCCAMHAACAAPHPSAAPRRAAAAVAACAVPSARRCRTPGLQGCAAAGPPCRRSQAAAALHHGQASRRRHVRTAARCCCAPPAPAAPGRYLIRCRGRRGGAVGRRHCCLGSAPCHARIGHRQRAGVCRCMLRGEPGRLCHRHHRRSAVFHTMSLHVVQEAPALPTPQLRCDGSWSGTGRGCASACASSRQPRAQAHTAGRGCCALAVRQHRSVLRSGCPALVYSLPPQLMLPLQLVQGQVTAWPCMWRTRRGSRQPGHTPPQSLLEAPWPQGSASPPRRQLWQWRAARPDLNLAWGRSVLRCAGRAEHHQRSAVTAQPGRAGVWA